MAAVLGNSSVKLYPLSARLPTAVSRVSDPPDGPMHINQVSVAGLTCSSFTNRATPSSDLALIHAVCCRTRQPIHIWMLMMMSVGMGTVLPVIMSTTSHQQWRSHCRACQ